MAAFDVQAFIDRQPLKRVHVVVAALALLAMFIDGFDIFMVGKIAPAIADGFGVSAEKLTLIFVLQQTGLAVGAFLVSPLSDIYGRKRLLVISFIAFGVLTIAGAFATSVLMLAILRGVAGLFLAGVLPAAIALVSETTPRAQRGAVIGLAQAGYSAGNALGASMAFLVPVYGWQSAFWVGGGLALLLVPLLMFFTHESLSYLTRQPHRRDRVAAVLRQIDPQVELTGDESFVMGPGKRNASASPFEIFAGGRLAMTLALWVCFLLSMGNIALLSAWLPSFFKVMAGVTIQQFAVALMVSLIGGLVGISTVGFVMDRAKPLPLVACYYLGNAIALAALGLVPFSSPGFMPLLALFSFCQAGGQGGLNVLVALLYPPAVRATGLGWAGGLGRIGGIAAPALGGLALAHGFNLPTTLGLIALSPLAVACMLIGVLVPLRAAKERRASAVPAKV